MKLALFTLLTLLSGSYTFAQNTPWTVVRTTWTSQDELNYSAFVQAIGESNCRTVSDCMRSPANPYRYSDPPTAKFWSDCADWPYFLRAYFAWKNGLPFAYTASVGMMPAEEVKEDERTSQEGNFPKSRYAMNSGKATVDFLKEVNKMQNRISSAMLRVRPDYNGDILNDFYSPEIKPNSIRPGTVIYDADGHVYVIYRIESDGRMQLFDAHPDNSITYGSFGEKNARSRPNQGAGFKNFRPMRAFNEQIQTVPNEHILDYSLTQYYGSTPNYENWKKGTFSLRGRTMDFHEYVRAAMATSKINPVQEFETSLKELCENFSERQNSVEVATADGIHLKPHPASIPKNIFQSQGDWETYSTPSRDVRLRIAFLGLQKSINYRYNQYVSGDRSDIQYSGQNLKRDLLGVFHNANLNCPVSYKNSAGKSVNLSFELAINRLYSLSFDPFACPERRWGAESKQELASCTDDADKTAWHQGQQRIRNLLRRDWVAAQDITLETLKTVGASAAEPINVRGWLTSLADKGNSLSTPTNTEKQVTLNFAGAVLRSERSSPAQLDLSKELLKQSPGLNLSGQRLKSVVVKGSSSAIGATATLLVSGKALDSQTVQSSSASFALSSNVGSTPGQWSLGVRGQLEVQQIVLTLDVQTKTNDEFNFERAQKIVRAVPLEIPGNYSIGQIIYWAHPNKTLYHVKVAHVNRDGSVVVSYNGQQYEVRDIESLGIASGCSENSEYCVNDPIIARSNDGREYRARIVGIQSDRYVIVTFDNKKAISYWPTSSIRYE